MTVSRYTQPLLISMFTSDTLILLVTLGGAFALNLFCSEIYNTVTNGPISSTVMAFVIPLILQITIAIVLFRLNVQSNMLPAIIAPKYLRYLVDCCTDDNVYEEMKATMELWRSNDQNEPMVDLALNLMDFKHSVLSSRIQNNKVTVSRRRHFVKIILQPFLILMVISPGTIVLNLLSSYISDLLKHKEEWKNVLAFVVPLTVQIATGLSWWAFELTMNRKMFEKLQSYIRNCTLEDYEQLKNHMEKWHNERGAAIESELESIFDRASHSIIDVPPEASERNDQTQVLKGAPETKSHLRRRRGQGGASSGPPAGVTQVNESVWKLYSPEGEHEVDIIFFHGLHKSDDYEDSDYEEAVSDYENAYWKTWCNDEGKLWPNTLLGEKLPRARILAVSYDSSLRETPPSGRHDMDNIGEKFVGDIIDSGIASVGLGDRPVVLVGHCLGGIVIKHFLLAAFRKKNDLNPALDKAKIDAIQNFLFNLCGIFYYATPHAHTILVDLVHQLPGTSPVLEYLKTLMTQMVRLNEDFRRWRGMFKIRTFSIGENRSTDFASWGVNVNDVAVEEASVRYDADYYYIVIKNHFDVCKHTSANESSFQMLLCFVIESVRNQARSIVTSASDLA